MSETSLYPIVHGMRIDIDALRRLAHRCVPEKCSTRTRGCCATYEVTVERKEIGTIIGSLEGAAQYAPHLREDGDFIETIEDTDGGSCLSTDEDGRCVFAYHDANRTTLCSLHSVAIDLSLPPIDVKPRSCALWPLALVEEEPPLLTVQEDAQQFPCNRSRSGHALHTGVAQTIEEVFGSDFRAAVENSIQ